MARKPTVQELRKLGLAHDKQIEKNGDEVVQALRQFFKNYIRDAQSLITDRANQADKLDLVTATAIAADLETLTRDAGLPAVLKKYQAALDASALKAIEYFEPFGFSLGIEEVDTDTLDKLANIQIDDLVREVDRKLVRPLQDAVINSTVGTASPDDAVAQIKDIINSEGILAKDGSEFADSQVETLVKDSQVRFYRDTKARQAEDLGMRIVVYEGPFDNKTRPACQALLTSGTHGVENMYYVEEFNTSISPDLVESPLIAGGGYNCRHIVNFLTLETAKAAGFEP
jgi:hypothetical protein